MNDETKAAPKEVEASLQERLRQYVDEIICHGAKARSLSAELRKSAVALAPDTESKEAGIAASELYELGWLCNLGMERDFVISRAEAVIEKALAPRQAAGVEWRAVESIVWRGRDGKDTGARAFNTVYPDVAASLVEQIRADLEVASGGAEDTKRLNLLESLYSDTEWNTLFRESVSLKETIRQRIDVRLASREHTEDDKIQHGPHGTTYSL